MLAGCGGPYATYRISTPSLGQADQIKVMTFNIRTRTIIDGPNHWNHRKNTVAKVIANNNADIIGIQESKSSQTQYLRSTLPGYASYAAGRSNGVRGGESCPVLYRKDRFTLMDAGTFWFSDTPSVAGSKDWGNLPPRICSWVRLSEKNTGTSLYVYNVHLDNLSQNSRKKSIQLLTKMIGTRKTNDPFIIMGDFNMEMRNPAMRYFDWIGQRVPLLASLDVWQTIHPNRKVGTRHGFRGRLSGPQIDHIRLSASLRPMDVRIDTHHRNGRYPSDHFPVVAKVQISSPGYSLNTTTPRHVPVARERARDYFGAL